MAQTEEIIKSEFLEAYARGELEECINTGTRLYARSVTGQYNGKFKVVWCTT